MSDSGVPGYIVIEGPIGVGKTTLACKIAESLGSETLLEQPKDNPFLANFYQNPKSHALSAQLFFLLQRIKRIQQLVNRDGIFPNNYVADFMIERDRLFAETNLNEKELFLYQSIYEQLTISVPAPDRVIYLQAPVNILEKRIQKRGVEYEENIKTSYLERIHDAYGKFFMRYDDAPLLIINTATVHLLDNNQEYEHFFELMLNAKSGHHFYNTTLL